MVPCFFFLRHSHIDASTSADKRHSRSSSEHLSKSRGTPHKFVPHLIRMSLFCKYEIFSNSQKTSSLQVPPKSEVPTFLHFCSVPAKQCPQFNSLSEGCFFLSVVSGLSFLLSLREAILSSQNKYFSQSCRRKTLRRAASNNFTCFLFINVTQVPNSLV